MSDLLTIDHLFWACFAGLCLAAAVCDVRSYRIPNAISVAILGLYVVRLVVSDLWAEALDGFLVMGAVLSIGFVLFALRWLGGGDVKLMSVVALWSGGEEIFRIFYTIALTGGVMALALLVYLTCVALSAKVKNAKSRGRIRNQKLPYGVAIAAGALDLSLQRTGVLEMLGV